MVTPNFVTNLSMLFQVASMQGSGFAAIYHLHTYISFSHKSHDHLISWYSYHVSVIANALSVLLLLGVLVILKCGWCCWNRRIHATPPIGAGLLVHVPCWFLTRFWGRDWPLQATQGESLWCTRCWARATPWSLIASSPRTAIVSCSSLCCWILLPQR